MKAANLFRSLQLRYFAQPKHHRALFRHIEQTKPWRIVQIGMGRGELAKSLLEMVLRGKPAERPRYVGIDLFESRPSSQPGLTLKEAHREVRSDQIDIRLLPGEPSTALSRLANELRGTDLVIATAAQNTKSLNGSWHLVSRILHKDSRIWLETEDGGQPIFRVLAPADIRSLIPVRKGRAA
ncbi:MAG TPA: hypothetical protein VIY86_02580 [Pirellulaceae bacterium]